MTEWITELINEWTNALMNETVWKLNSVFRFNF